MATPETLIKKQIKDYLSHKGYFHFPIMQGLGAQKGIPDIFAIKNGKVYAIEVKTPKGRQSQWQIMFQFNWEAEKGLYIIGGLDDVMKICK
jgi:hypothetical protein